MVKIKIFKEKREFGDYYSSSMALLLLIAIYLLFQFMVGIILYFMAIFNDMMINKLLTIMISQILLVLFIYFFLVQFFELNKEQKVKIEKNILKEIVSLFLISNSLIIFCILVVNNVGKVISQEITLSNDFILNQSINFSDQLIVILISISIVITSVIFSEFIFRRFLIPKLEKQGMTSKLAILTSSLLFACFYAIPSLKIPEYLMIVTNTIVFLINGSPAIFTELISFPFSLIFGSGLTFIFNLSIFLILGLATGYSYVRTRNITICIFIHSYMLLLIYISLVPFTIENTTIQGIYLFFNLCIIIIGSIVGILVIKSSKGKEIRHEVKNILSKRTNQAQNKIISFIFTTIFFFIIIDIMQFNLSIIPVFILTLFLYSAMIIFFTYNLFFVKKKNKDIDKNNPKNVEVEIVE